LASLQDSKSASTFPLANFSETQTDARALSKENCEALISLPRSRLPYIYAGF
jgi:hypothetical protein